MTTLRPNAQRAKNAIILIWVVMALDIASLVSSYLQYQLLQRAELGGYISEDAADANDTREMLIGILYLIAFVPCGVIFIQWFRRAYFNLHQLVPNLNNSEGWAAGAWFVPILNLFKPYQIMKELYAQTIWLLERRGVEHRLPPKGVIGLWWALWIISGILGRADLKMAMRAETIDALISSTVLSMVTGLVGIPLAILAVQVVKGYAAMEPLLAALPEAVPPPAPPAMLFPDAPGAVPPPAVQ